MTTENARDILAELSRIGKEVGVRTEVAITGGDPLVHPQFFKILKLARQYCDSVSVMGNPEKLSDSVIATMKRIGVDWFQLSLDGIAATHDKQRSVGSFQRTCGAIVALSKAGIKVNVNMTLGYHNEFEKHTTEAIAKTFGATHFSCEREIPYGEDCNGRNGHQCSLGFSVMAVLPDLTLMACRRTPSSVLGTWTKEQGLEYHFVNNPIMLAYRNKHEATPKQERRQKEVFDLPEFATGRRTGTSYFHEHYPREYDAVQIMDKFGNL